MKRIDRKFITVFIPTAALQFGTMILMGNVAVAQDISPPESFAYELYSSSTAELFWDRSSTLGLNHKIRRDGQPLDIISGVSYLDRTLSRGSAYTYDIVAIDSTGNRSALATLTFSGWRNNKNQTVLPPSGLRADVYSSLSAELFWDRPVEIELSYDISRDGALLETTNGVSFYARNLLPRAVQNFQVFAIDV
ncbi:MAG: hypothetical protein ACI9UN_000434 [Granulosicoccus sp.]|jgi:hypothetical protein